MRSQIIGQRHGQNFAQCEVSRQARFRTEGLTLNTAPRDNPGMPGPEFDLHSHLRAWRKHRRLTLEQVANQTGFKPNTISGWETGGRTVDLDDLKKLADVYEVTPALLLYAPPGSAKLRALDELSSAMDGMDPDTLNDLIKMAKKLVGT